MRVSRMYQTHAQVEKNQGRIFLDLEGQVAVIDEDGVMLLSGCIDIEPVYDGTNAVELIDELCDYWKENIVPCREDFHIIWADGTRSTFVTDQYEGQNVDHPEAQDVPGDLFRERSGRGLCVLCGQSAPCHDHTNQEVA